MSERITRQMVEERAENLNRRIESSGRFVAVQGRNGQLGLDEYTRDDERDGALVCLRTLTVGTKREVADFLHAMMVGIDLSRIQP